MRVAQSTSLLLAALLGAVSGCGPKKPEAAVIEMHFGTFKSPRCEIENPRGEFAIDEGMSMAVTSDRPFASQLRYTLYLSTLSEGPGGRLEKDEIDRLIMDIDPAQSVFCAAGPKLTPKQFGIKSPGRYRIEFWLGEERVASQDLVITAASPATVPANIPAVPPAPTKGG